MLYNNRCKLFYNYIFTFKKGVFDMKTNTNQKPKKMQIFFIQHQQLKTDVFTDAIEDGDYVHFKKHKILDSYEHVWKKEELGVVIENIFSVDAHVAFYESENMAEKAAELLLEHLEKRKVQEEEHHKKFMEDIEKLKKDLNNKSFKK